MNDYNYFAFLHLLHVKHGIATKAEIMKYAKINEAEFKVIYDLLSSPKLGYVLPVDSDRFIITTEGLKWHKMISDR